MGVSAIWAIDEFTADNGATELIPGSHTWDSEPAEPDDRDIERAVMPAGSVVVFLGTLLHRGGANRSNGSRLAVTPQYCERWTRQIETMSLAVPPAVASTFSSRVQALLGYGIYPPLIGYVDGRDPRRLLAQERPEAPSGCNTAPVANGDTCPRCGRPAFVQFFVDQDPVLGRYEHLDCPECDDTTDEPLEVSVVDRTEPDQWHLADLHEACWENAKLKAAAYAEAVEEEGSEGVIKPPHIWSLDS